MKREERAHCPNPAAPQLPTRSARPAPPAGFFFARKLTTSFKPRVLQGVAADGGKIVKVEMSNRQGTFVTVDADDYVALVAEGLPTRWFLNRAGSGHDYVRFAPGRFAGKLETVARRIVRSRPGRIVRYVDGDRLNLRRSNLYLIPGNARGQTPADEVGGQ